MSSTHEAHYMVMRGNGESGKRAIATYTEAGKMGNPMGYFNAGNCLIFGTMEVEENKEKGLKMWEEGKKLVIEGEEKALEIWAGETNEKVACRKKLDLRCLLRRCVCVMWARRWRGSHWYWCGRGRVRRAGIEEERQNHRDLYGQWAVDVCAHGMWHV